jgi:RES domain-containing protein
VRLWRICRKGYALDPLSGRGGLVASGRWHRRGRRVVYVSGSLALAALEYLTRVDREELPGDLIQIEIDVPDDLEIEEIEPASLPRNWQDYPAPGTLQRFGNEWLDKQRTSILRVPSAVIPEECNYLLNPAHPEAKSWAVIRARRFVYDRRLAR